MKRQRRMATPADDDELARRYRERHQTSAANGQRQVRRLRRMYVRRGQDLRRPANLARVDDGDGADRVEGRKRVNAALATMVAEANRRGIGDSSKKAAVGFCFGGGNVLELALGAGILCRTGSSRVSRAVRISQILFSN